MAAGDESPTIAELSDGFYDVEEFVCGNEGELARDRARQVFDYVQKGNQAFRSRRFEEAIKCYSRANIIKQGDPTILSNRCAAYIRLSQFLKSRPPCDSECNPLNGLDPTVHAEVCPYLFVCVYYFLW
uniref:Uncharacterized protein n=1 Tax=Opuntia streptacantha TaxID=393608 RepID=A0A7C9EKU9_OPUST